MNNAFTGAVKTALLFSFLIIQVGISYGSERLTTQKRQEEIRPLQGKKSDFYCPQCHEFCPPEDSMHECPPEAKQSTDTSTIEQLWCPHYLPHDNKSCQVRYHTAAQMAQHLREAHGAGRTLETERGGNRTPQAEQTVGERNRLFSSSEEELSDDMEERRFICPHAACREPYPNMLEMFRHFRDYHKEPRLQKAVIETTSDEEQEASNALAFCPDKKE